MKIIIDFAKTFINIFRNFFIIKRGMKVRNMAVILTNQVTTKISLSGPMGGPPQMTAAGGLAVAHTVTNRIHLKRATKAETKSRNDIEARKAIVEDSPFLADSSALFVLSDSGITDFSTSLKKEVEKPLSGDSDILNEEELVEELENETFDEELISKNDSSDQPEDIEMQVKEIKKKTSSKKKKKEANVKQAIDKEDTDQWEELN